MPSQKIESKPLSTAALLLLSSLLSFNPTAARAAEPPELSPTAVFTQAGIAEHARSVAVGADWDWAWRRSVALGELSGYWEVTLGGWGGEAEGAGGGRDWVAQIGVTPVLRLAPRAWGGRWFVEGGIGVNAITPRYRAEGARFSTVFNFGDHLALGRTFGERGAHEVALRLEHFSNGGIEEPNPGENFVQLRYTRRF